MILLIPAKGGVGSRLWSSAGALHKSRSRWYSPFLSLCASPSRAGVGKAANSLPNCANKHKSQHNICLWKRGLYVHVFSLHYTHTFPFPNYQHVNEVWQRFQLGKYKGIIKGARKKELTYLMVCKHFHTYLSKHILNRLIENEVMMFSAG